MEANTNIISGTGKVPAGEFVGHALGGLGHNTVYALWSGSITAFYTDVYGLNPAFMALLFLAARIWDGVNDPMMGIISDRSKSRLGRFRCWLLRMPLLVGICLILNFSVPSMAGTAKLVYAAVTYILMGMAFTSVDIPFWSLPTAMTSDPQERTNIFTTTTMTTNVASALASSLIPILILSFGGPKGAGAPHAYFMTAAIIASIGFVLYLTCFTLVREHVKPPLQKFSFKSAFKAVYTNKPLFCVMITNLVLNMAFITKMTFGYYYFSYSLGNYSLMAVMGLLTVPCMVIGSLSVPFLVKRLGKKNSIIGLTIVELAVSILFFFSGYGSIPLVMTFSVIQVILVGAATVIINAMTADTTEYGEWMTGQRNEGIITSTRTLITKVASALVGAITGVILIGSHYNHVAAVQATYTMNAFHLVVSLLPGVVMFIGVIPMFFYPLTEERHAQIVAEINARRAEKGEPTE